MFFWNFVGWMVCKDWFLILDFVYGFDVDVFCGVDFDIIRNFKFWVVFVVNGNGGK